MLKILIVDDELKHRLLYRVILEDEEDFQIFEASNGKKALEIAQGIHPDLIILDAAMPEMDGFEVCRHIKSNPETRAIKVIILTARIRPDDEALIQEVCTDDYLTKPFHPHVLLKKVKKLLARKPDKTD